MIPEEVRALDQLRQRIDLLYTSIASLRQSLENNEMPTWPSLQSTAAAVSYNLQQLNETMHAHRTLLREAHAYPLSTFPGLSQHALLEQLLRKKLEPRAEGWIDEYTSMANDVTTEGSLSRDEFADLWSWAKETSTSIARPMYEEGGAFEDNFTIAEREAGIEKVVTGLKMKLDGQDSDEEDEDDKMEDVMPSAAAAATAQTEAGIDATLPAIPLDNILKFTTTGALPGSAGNPLPREIAAKLGKG